MFGRLSLLWFTNFLGAASLALGHVFLQFGLLEVPCCRTAAHLLRRANVIKRESLDLAWDDMAPELLTHLLCSVAGRTDQMSAAAGKRFDVADAHPHLRADFCHPRFGQRRVYGAAQAMELGQA